MKCNMQSIYKLTLFRVSSALFPKMLSDFQSHPGMELFQIFSQMSEQGHRKTTHSFASKIKKKEWYDDDKNGERISIITTE